MRTFHKVAAIAALIAVALFTGSLQAQQAGDDEADNKAPADVTVPMEKTAKLTPAEMRAKADELVANMQGIFNRVLEIQQIARTQKDVIKLNCVNDRLLQIKQLLNIAESSRTDLIEAISKQDESGRYHRFSLVTIAFENITTLREEAEACVGNELTFLGPTEVLVDKPDILDDPTFIDPGGVLIERPAYASVFL